MRSLSRSGLSFLLLFGLTSICYCGTSGSSKASGPGSPGQPQSSAPESSSGGNAGAPSNPTDVITYHYDNARDGLNSHETTLTTSNVNSSGFQKLGLYGVDAKVDAQPLYLNQVTIQGTAHNVLYVETEGDSAYAFDADTGAQLWKVSALGQGETTSDDHGCGQISPQIGITNTPLIDRSEGPNGAIYFVAMTKDSSQNYHQRLHALDITTGAELFGGPKEIQASYPGSGDGSQNGHVIFAPGQYAERAGLLEYVAKVGITTNLSTLYLGFTSHCDERPYTGWLMAYDPSTLNQKSVIDLTPNGSEGSIWMAGAGIAADSAGNVFFLDANGTFDTQLNSRGFPVNGDFGNAFIKVSAVGVGGQLQVTDYFAMYNTVQESNADEDLGSGGAMLLPDLRDNSNQVHHLAVGAGKDTNIYVVNRDNMGKFNPNNDNAIYQEIDGALPGGVWSMPAYFNNTVYYGNVGDHLKAFAISNAKLSTAPTSQTASSFTYPGTTPSVSANGTSNGIVWAVENSNPAVLHAYDASNLAHELYNSNQAGSRDQFGPGNKFITPIVANGKVFVGTPNGVAVFGLNH